ncbi:FecR family protein [Pseudomonas aeruginosa]|nr:FecR family protein [Pseudomonas aeruginosa]
MSADDRHSPVRARVLDEAIAWQLLLDSGEAHPDDHRAFHRWYAAHPEHERAWEQLGGLDRHLARAANGPARNALLSGNARFKRRLRRLGGSALGLVLALGVGLGVANRYVPVRYLLADAYSATGEQRELTLPDATHVRLNSRSAIDVRFDGERRQVVLLAGEILVETAHGDPRPFVVSSADGDMRALGTRFLVRREEPGTRLTVLQSAVAARAETLSEERVIKEGQQVLILPQGLQASEAAPALAGAWAQGMLVVENARLADLVAERGRYSPALLRVDPSIADLRVTGSFPLKDTRLALQALEPSLPVRSVRHNAWWFEVVPR